MRRKGKPTENKEEANHEEEHHEEVKLTAEQQKAIGLETGFITKRNLKTALKVNGKLMLPPQNLSCSWHYRTPFRLRLRH